MADLPPEILSEIFSRLPVKSLLRFRSTSKSLKSLIDSHKFINLHLQNSLNFNLILRRKTDLYHLHFPNLTTAVPLNHPFIHHSNNIALLGSCNGLLAISNGEIAFTNPYSANEIAFCNPTIRKHRIIPYLPLPIPSRSQSDNIALCVHGFGFDSLSADYKLLRISWFVDLQHHTFDNSHLTLFSSKTNSWKTLPDMPYILYYTLTMGVFVENSLHWIMTPKLDGLQPCLIAAFNLSLEIFNEVPLPDEIISNESFKISIAVLGGCLCLPVNYQTTKIDVWVMKEYGCRDSWCKHFTLVKSCLDFLRPLGYCSDGSKVLLEIDCKKLFWYDLKSEQISYVEGIPNLDDTMICVGSLVSPSLPVDNRRKKQNRTSKGRYFLLFD
ncbi:putative F-box domain-containing protein [Medicago truncatula]|uniref:F-box protein interaction domain protein n=1 Tax=Medicago truncatula TaxID=3880 RepID=G7ISR0_MEDTR|nr:F-box protein interaction domain protein [Medicago truncatula]RHN72747.1 putative F-box domain-containing protein [Medicago truncatula]